VHRIAAELRARIERGEYAPGQRFPTEFELAAEWETARNTVRGALQQLRNEGLIDVRQGHGTFVRDLRQRPTTQVPARDGDSVIARMPSPDEVVDYELAEGIPMLVLRRRNGSTKVYPGGQNGTEITYGGAAS
jgi:DNA-binding transcriptional MocR family regulator